MGGSGRGGGGSSRGGGGLAEGEGGLAEGEGGLAEEEGGLAEGEGGCQEGGSYIPKCGQMHTSMLLVFNSVCPMPVSLLQYHSTKPLRVGQGEVEAGGHELSNISQ